MRADSAVRAPVCGVGRSRRHLLALTFLLSISAAAPCVAAGGSPTEAERQALASLRGKLAGLIVWESNRSGSWELYAMNADGTGARRLTDLARSTKSSYTAYLRPQVSPDGKTILFGYGKHSNAAECWLVTPAGNDARRLCAGLPLNWSTDGKRIHLLRDGLVRSYELHTGLETVVSQTPAPTDGKSGSTVGTLHRSLKSVVLRTPRSNEVFVFAEGKTIKSTGGCEPRFSADGRYMYWVQGPRDFRVWDIAGDAEHQLIGTPPVETYNYTYFPTVSDDGRWLLYGASPGEHDHDTSDYEAYLVPLSDWKAAGAPVRLTYNSATDRWPHLWVAPPGGGNPLPEGPYDVASNRATNPPPPPLWLFSFSKKDAKPEFGGEWGLWPQEQGCRGEATFMDKEDAEGGNGGSMKIDYDISAAPRSFSLWMTAGPRRADLSAYDRFVIYARGSVPSFTLVVKDRNAGDPDAPEGIVERRIAGLTDRWQRFEVLFRDFVPRRPGGRFDWRAVNHIGIALIAPQDAETGTLWVDNLRAERGDVPH